MLRKNDSDSFPGAGHFAANPIAGNECCLHSTTMSLSDALSAAGVPYTFRAGRLWFDATQAQLEDICLGVAPTIQGLSTSEWEDAIGISMDVDDRGAIEGEVWVGDAATWAASVVRVEQTVDTWGTENVEITTVQGEFPLSPPVAYAYVMNACGRPNAVGFEITWIEV